MMMNLSSDSFSHPRDDLSEAIIHEQQPEEQQGKEDEMSSTDDISHTNNPVTAHSSESVMDFQQPQQQPSYTDDTQSEVNHVDSEMSAAQATSLPPSQDTAGPSSSSSSNNHLYIQHAAQHEMLLQFYQARMSECAAAYASAAAGAAWAASALLTPPPDSTLASPQHMIPTPMVVPAAAMFPPANRTPYYAPPTPLWVPPWTMTTTTIPPPNPYVYPHYQYHHHHHPQDPAAMFPTTYWDATAWSQASMPPFALPMTYYINNNNTFWDGEIEVDEEEEDVQNVGEIEEDNTFQSTKKQKRAVHNSMKSLNPPPQQDTVCDESNHMNMETSHDSNMSRPFHNNHAHYTHKQHTKKKKSLNHEVYDTVSNVMHPKKTKKSIFQPDSGSSLQQQVGHVTGSTTSSLSDPPFYTTTTPKYHHYGMYYSHHLPKPFNPMGKSAISALFELCHKRKWDPPRFVEVSIVSTTSAMATAMVLSGDEEEGSGENHLNIDDTTDAPSIASPTCSNPIKTNEYIYAVYLNQQEMGRGRGGTKKSAQHDAARKALTFIFPSMMFNESGIIVDLGSKGAHSLHSSANDVPEEDSTLAASNSKILEEQLAPKLASRLAINSTSLPMKPKVVDGGLKRESSPSPPSTVFVESSSKFLELKPKTTLVGSLHSDKDSLEKKNKGLTTRECERAVTSSTTACKEGDEILHITQPLSTQQLEDIAPFDLQVHVARSLSEINVSLMDPSASTLSGISSVSDEDEYYASRGASICSALLHAISQIHARITAPPEFSYHTIPSESSSSALLVSCDMSNSQKLMSNQQTKTESPENWDNRIIDKSREDENESESEGLISHQVYLDEFESSRVIQHRLSFSCTASVYVSGLSDDRGLEAGDFEDIESHISSEGMQDVNHTERRKLFAVGTGSTKRDAKHVASAKLLSLLFPQCHGILEVIRAAEDVRERHAASRAAVRQSKRVTSSHAL